jgi:predicted dehydrogenase
MSNQAEHPGSQRATGKRSNPRIKLGIVGCGEVTQIMHWPTLSQLAELYEVTALCDISPLVLETLGKRWNVGALDTDHRELVGRTDVDAVLVASPHAFHAEVTLTAIEAGKHVLVEKPMCINRREAKEMVKCGAMHLPFYTHATRSRKLALSSSPASGTFLVLIR